MSDRTHLFGTDGVRGRAQEDLTPELVTRLVRAAVRQLPRDQPARVLIVRDTRGSGEMLESAAAAGIMAAGGDAFLAGVLPTPAAPLLLPMYHCHLAVVISASHNPHEDNGIKFFGSNGSKLDDATELRIEAELDAPVGPPAGFGTLHHLEGALEQYVRLLQVRFERLNLSGLRVLLDCANGASFRAAPMIFRLLGADVTTLAGEPDGRNINDGCGSTHIEPVVAMMRAGDYDIAFAFDGDADRVLAVDRNGIAVDGDELLALAALYLRERGRLPGNGVAVTVMTNYGFDVAMRAAGIEVARTAVGDRNVAVELRQRGWAVGGEQSGHAMDLRDGPTGDGIATGLRTLEALGGRDLSEREAMQKLPQVLVNVPTGDRASLSAAMNDPTLNEAIDRERVELEGQILVRASGTEPVIRVMVQAVTKEEAEQVCDRLVTLVKRAVASST